MRVEVIAQPSSDPGYVEVRCPACRKLLGRWATRPDSPHVLGRGMNVAFETQCTRGNCKQFVRIVLQ